jgi:hypothetical protein
MSAPSTTFTKYRRGVQRLRPELVERIREELASDPSITKSELARRVGVSRQTIHTYLRRLPGDAAAATARASDARETTLMTTHVDLIANVSRAVEDVQDEIRKLRAGPSSPGTSGVIFRGFGTLERLWRLLGEILGEVAPPQQTLYITQVTALLNRPFDPARLSPSASALPGLGGDGAATR